jgi:hypothetical protein
MLEQALAPHAACGAGATRLTPVVSGYGTPMAERSEETNLDEVMVPTERTHPDHRAHAKADKHVDDDELQRRTDTCASWSTRNGRGPSDCGFRAGSAA